MRTTAVLAGFGLVMGCASRSPPRTALPDRGVQVRVGLTAPEVTDHDVEVLRRRATSMGVYRLERVPDGVELHFGEMGDVTVLLARLIEPRTFTFHQVRNAFDEDPEDSSAVRHCLGNTTFQCTYLTLGPSVLSAVDVADARAQPGYFHGSYVVRVDFTAQGSTTFCEVTERWVGERFAMVIDGTVLSAPVIRERICGGSASIESGVGTSGRADAETLAARIREATFGALEQRWTVVTVEHLPDGLAPRPAGERPAREAE